jgi:protein TonB
MFEGSLVASRGLEGSGTGRSTALGSITLQCTLAGLLLVIPMLRPGTIPVVPAAPHLIAPVMPKPVVVPVHTSMVATSSSALIAPAPAPAPASGPRIILSHPGGVPDDPAPAFDPNLRMGTGGTGPFSALSGGGDLGQPAAVTRASSIGPVRVSSGVSDGMLLSPIQPVYPSIARAAGVQGAVVLQATISTAGRIESLHVVSGPPMLRQAALDAVQAARYRPYKLNGVPTEVQTTITVVFRLGE